MTAEGAGLPLPLPVLLGERVLLRGLCAADAPALRRQADDPEVARFLFDGFPQPYTLEDAQRWCGRDAASGAFGYVWGIVPLEAPAEVAGCIGLLPEPGWLRCNAEIGYWLGRSHWRRGLGRDAVRQVADWAFAALPELTRIVAPILAGNAASQALAQACGFVREAVLPRSALKDGRAVDRVLWTARRPEVLHRPTDMGPALAANADNGRLAGGRGRPLD